MIYIPSLVSKINQFHNSAIKNAAEYKEPMIYTSPDDEEESAPDSEQDNVISGLALYQSSMQIVSELEHPKMGNTDMAEILYCVAEKYKLAIELKGGYAEVIAALNHARDQLIDVSNEAIEDDPKSEDRIDDLFDQSKDITDQMEDDLRLQMKSIPKNEQMPDDVIHQQLLSISDNFLGAGAKEMMQQKVQYDMFGGGESDVKGKSQFGHTIGPDLKNVSDPHIKYKDEAAEYGKKLTNIPDTPANQKLRENITRLIQSNLALNEQANKVTALRDDLSIMPEEVSSAFYV